MRFLKKKVNLVKSFEDESDCESCCGAHTEHTEPETETQTQLPSPIETVGAQCSSPISAIIMEEYPIAKRKPRQNASSPHADSKNIIKNYGKAMCSFASSQVSLMYLKTIVKENSFEFISIPGFMSYIKEKKSETKSIESIRKLLVINEGDSKEIATYKKIFKEVSVVFLKYFAVNWIFGGRLYHKIAHLKFRFKMLRRIQDPENFTYLRSSAA